MKEEKIPRDGNEYRDIAVLLPSNMLEVLDDFCKLSRQSRSSVVVQALDHYFHIFTKGRLYLYND